MAFLKLNFKLILLGFTPREGYCNLPFNYHSLASTQFTLQLTLPALTFPAVPTRDVRAPRSVPIDVCSDIAPPAPRGGNPQAHKNFTVTLGTMVTASTII